MPGAKTGFPTKGFEVQINNTAGGEGTYRERKKTGSLYGLRNVYKQLINDGQWFKMHVLVRGKNVQVRLDGVLVVDYTEPKIDKVEPLKAELTAFVDCILHDSEPLVKEIPPKGADLSAWYTAVCLKAELVSYAPVRGCVVLRPYGFGLWENLQRELDAGLQRGALS